MDKLIITGIKITTLIGIHAWEKKCPQNLYLDLALKTDARSISETDTITKAIDYDKIMQHIFDFTANNHFQLIETLAEKMASELLSHFPTDWVQITLHKPGALLHAKNVAISLERSK